MACTAVPKQNAGSAHFATKQLLPFGFAEPCRCQEAIHWRLKQVRWLVWSMSIKDSIPRPCALNDKEGISPRSGPFYHANPSFSRLVHGRHYPANTIHWPNVDLTLVQRLRRWPNIKSTLDQHLVFTVSLILTRFLHSQGLCLIWILPCPLHMSSYSMSLSHPDYAQGHSRIVR